jgi:hypothetical protein
LLGPCRGLTNGLFSFPALVGEAACLRRGVLPLGFCLLTRHVRPALRFLCRLFRRDQLRVATGPRR